MLAGPSFLAGGCRKKNNKIPSILLVPSDRSTTRKGQGQGRESDRQPSVRPSVRYPERRRRDRRRRCEGGDVEGGQEQGSGRPSPLFIHQPYPFPSRRFSRSLQPQRDRQCPQRRHQFSSGLSPFVSVTDGSL